MLSIFIVVPLSLPAWEVDFVSICYASALFVTLGSRFCDYLLWVRILPVPICCAGALFANLGKDFVTICCASALFASLERVEAQQIATKGISRGSKESGSRIDIDKIVFPR